MILHGCDSIIVCRERTLRYLKGKGVFGKCADVTGVADVQMGRCPNMQVLQVTKTAEWLIWQRCRSGR